MKIYTQFSNFYDKKILSEHLRYRVRKQNMESFLKRFLFGLISPILKKNAMNLNFHDQLKYSSIFSFKFSPMWGSKKRNDKESMICLTPKPIPPKFFLK